MDSADIREFESLVEAAADALDQASFHSSASPALHARFLRRLHFRPKASRSTASESSRKATGLVSQESANRDPLRPQPFTNSGDGFPYAYNQTPYPFPGPAPAGSGDVPFDNLASFIEAGSGQDGMANGGAWAGNGTLWSQLDGAWWNRKLISRSSERH